MLEKQAVVCLKPLKEMTHNQECYIKQSYVLKLMEK